MNYRRPLSRSRDDSRDLAGDDRIDGEMARQKNGVGRSFRGKTKIVGNKVDRIFVCVQTKGERRRDYRKINKGKKKERKKLLEIEVEKTIKNLQIEFLSLTKKTKGSS